MKHLLLSAAILAIPAMSQAAPIALNEIRDTTTTSTGSLVSDGLYDAFDGAFRLLDTGGLSVQRDIATLEDTYTYRVLDVFTNTTAATITASVRNYTNLGSDGSEHVVEEGVDRSTTFQDRNPTDGSPVNEFDPVISFTYGNNAFSAANITGDVGYNRFDMTMNLSLGAGESIGILYFATLIRDNSDRSGDVAAAQAIAASLAANPGEGTELSDAQRAIVANFDNVVAPVPLPASLPFLLAGLGGLAWAARRKS
ncbi:VPLPA-CTERM sorting domain-containing protein [Primorskyibacter sp. S187A]|uniref:VPLPA-CTERM sorting domain-containing protein n=1 Tax=Primorskyibacter sp. S187A TaxID=3415130 RepID=UPI003C7AF771